ncbi:hypothetical protein GQ44DRAFT_630230 [Phaeosphaeriaceae sp. PMI808]|nr:hypothetical protein GQ44DRAFT_630230 [Phaeosphaeriaceae sp. PMI808]
MSPNPDVEKADAQRDHNPDQGSNPYGDEDKPAQPVISSHKSAVPELTEKGSQRQPEDTILIQRGAGSNRELSIVRPSLSITELTQQCCSCFETCVRHESLMKKQWAENRFADFNLFCDGVGALSASRTSLDSRLKSRPDDLVMVKSILTMLKGFLVQCIESVESCSSADDAMTSVDSSLENLALIAVAIRNSGNRSRLRKADGKFKPEEHTELRNILRILCWSHHTGEDLGKETKKDAFKFEHLSTQELIDTSNKFELSEPQQRLIEVNLRRRNRILRAQEHSKVLKADYSTKISDIKEKTDAKFKQPAHKEPVLQDRFVKTTIKNPGTEVSPHAPTPTPTLQETKASTAEGNLLIPKVKQPNSRAETRITFVTGATRYPRAPELCEDLTMFKCPCCCKTLPAEFGTNKTLWKYDSRALFCRPRLITK